MSRLDLFRGAVADKFPVVRESLRESLERGGARAEQLAEWILGIFAPMVPNGEHDLAAAFARMVMKLNRAQLRYEMTGAYPERGVEDVHETVYGDTEGMTAYMLGLACSQFAWTNHFQLWCFYEELNTEGRPTWARNSYGSLSPRLSVELAWGVLFWWSWKRIW